MKKLIQIVEELKAEAESSKPSFKEIKRRNKIASKITDDLYESMYSLGAKAKIIAGYPLTTEDNIVTLQDELDGSFQIVGRCVPRNREVYLVQYVLPEPIRLTNPTPVDNYRIVIEPAIQNVSVVIQNSKKVDTCSMNNTTELRAFVKNNLVENGVLGQCEVGVLAEVVKRMHQALDKKIASYAENLEQVYHTQEHVRL